jgi:hypothetical protein
MYIRVKWRLYCTSWSLLHEVDCNQPANEDSYMSRRAFICNEQHSNRHAQPNKADAFCINAAKNKREGHLFVQTPPLMNLAMLKLIVAALQ